jgi:hypothetical protein
MIPLSLQTGAGGQDLPHMPVERVAYARVLCTGGHNLPCSASALIPAAAIAAQPFHIERKSQIADSARAASRLISRGASGHIYQFWKSGALPANRPLDFGRLPDARSSPMLLWQALPHATGPREADEPYGRDHQSVAGIRMLIYDPCIQPRR